MAREAARGLQYLLTPMMTYPTLTESMSECRTEYSCEKAEILLTRKSRVSMALESKQLAQITIIR